MIGRPHIACGKVILLGEHAVVHGHAALAGAIDRGVRCAFDGRPHGDIRLAVPHWDLEVTVGDDHPVARALDALARGSGADHLSLSLHAVAEIPAAAGLGSSAALCVAMTRALAMAAGRHLAEDQVMRVADAGERCFHDSPSGVDVALATRGGIGLYRRGDGLAPIDAAPMPIIVGLSGEPRHTAAMVAKVGRALEDRPEEVGARLAAMGDAAERGAELVRTGDTAGLGGELSAAQAHLAALGLSTRIIDSMVEAALAAGATGAKLTGAGGGGAVIAVAPGREDQVIEAWQRQGREVFRTEVGGSL